MRTSWLSLCNVTDALCTHILSWVSLLHLIPQMRHPPKAAETDETRIESKDEKERGRIFHDKINEHLFIKYLVMMSPGTHPIRGLWSGEGFVSHCALHGWNALGSHGPGLAVTVATLTAKWPEVLRSWAAWHPPHEGLHRELIAHTNSKLTKWSTVQPVNK